MIKIKYSNRHKLSDVLVEMLMQDDYDYNEDPKTFSASELIDDPHRIKLMSITDAEVELDVLDRFKLIQGNLIHNTLEKIARQYPERYICEERFSWVFDDITITGKIDLYDRQLKEIQDYKSTTKYKVSYGKYDEKWEEQTNIYAYLLRKHGYEVNAITVFPMIRDLHKKDQYDSAFPKTDIFPIDIPLWDMEKTELFIKEKIAGILNVGNSTACSKKNRWATDTKYKVFKKGNKQATKVCNSPMDAAEFKNTHKFAKEMFVQEVPGQDNRCMECCIANKFCSYYQETYPHGNTMYDEEL
jgi:hypothetical protein